MPCGSGNGREMMVKISLIYHSIKLYYFQPGNQFIYVRTADAKYGPTSDPNGEKDGTWQEIHVNFRLHHTFCNMFFEVDFMYVSLSLFITSFLYLMLCFITSYL
jgi:hypothetical protein